MSTAHTDTDPPGKPPATYRFVRDRATWTRYGQLGLFAFLIDGYAPTVPLLAADLHLPLPLAALHGTAFGAGVLLAGTVSAPLSRNIGRGPLSWIGVTGICLGLGAYLLSTSVIFTLAGIGLAGFSGAVMLAAANAQLSEQHGYNGARALNEGAAVSQGAGITAPLVIGAAAATAAGWRAGLLILVVLAVILALTAVSHRSRHERRDVPMRERPMSAVKQHQDSRLPARFAAVWLSTVVVLGIEFSLMMWTPTFLSEQTGLDPSLATASIAVTLTGMMIGRFAFAPFTRSDTLDRLLALAVLIFLAGFTVFWLSGNPVLSLGALFITGLGISAQYPLSLARLIRSSEGRTDTATAWSAVAMGLALASAPFLLGILGGAWGINAGILLAPALGVLTLLLVALSSSRRPGPPSLMH